MNKDNEFLIRLGSATAKNGFKNEKDIADKFNNWQVDNEAQLWLQIMQYNLNEIEFVKAVILHNEKSDINVQIMIKLKSALDIENIQVKLVSNKSGFNQIDKRWVDNYVKLWNIPNNITHLLKLFCGEVKPNIVNKGRLFITDFSIEEQQEFLKFFDNNKVLIVNDILKGRGKFAAEWILVAQKINNNARWILKSMNEAINYYFADGKVKISPRGSLKIGKITMQRKGGDNGRKTANMLQFKIDPSELFNI